MKAQIESFLKANLPAFCTSSVRRGNLRLASKFVERLPLGAPYRLFLNQLGQSTLLTLLNFAVGSGQTWVALRLMDLLLARYPLAPNYEGWENHASELVQSLPVSSMTMRNVSSYLKANPESPLNARFGAWLSNAQISLRAA